MKKDKDSIYLSWKDIDNDCNKIAQELSQSGLKFDTIIMIQRGGLIPGTILSHKLKCSHVHTISIRTTETEDNYSRRLKIPIVNIPPIMSSIIGMRVLIIDDVTNSGVTINLAKREILKYKPATCITAVLIWDGYNNACCSADYYARYTPGWVVFPWEY